MQPDAGFSLWEDQPGDLVEGGTGGFLTPVSQAADHLPQHRVSAAPARPPGQLLQLAYL